MARGRPREFDVEQVLAAAQHVFWAKGFEGASMAELTDATGLKPGSVYAAFGSKAGLFDQVLDHYVRTVFSYAHDAVAAPTVREVVRRWLHGAVLATTGQTTPPGCLLVHGALAASDAAAEVSDLLRRRNQEAQQMLAARLRQGHDDGDLPTTVDVQAAAGYVLALASGLAVQAAGGADRDSLEHSADLALTRLPWE